MIPPLPRRVYITLNYRCAAVYTYYNNIIIIYCRRRSCYYNLPAVRLRWRHDDGFPTRGSRVQYFSTAFFRSARTISLVVYTYGILPCIRNCYYYYNRLTYCDELSQCPPSPRSVAEVDRSRSSSSSIRTTLCTRSCGFFSLEICPPM